MQLNYKEYSTEGPVLVILHGLFGSLSNWGWHSKQLAEEFRVIGVDLRNHGDSPHDEAMNYEVMAGDLYQLLNELGIEECMLMGHSMGGKVAMQLALTHPELVQRLVVVDIAPVNYAGKADGHLEILRAMQGLDMSTIKSRKQAEQQMASAIEDEATRKFIMTNISRDESGRYHWRLNLDAIAEHYDELRMMPENKGVFDKPTLFVRGDLSRYIQKKHEPEILRLFPQAGVKSVMETGHWVHAEKPEVFQKVARDFLSGEQSAS